MNPKYCAMHPKRITGFSERALDWLVERLEESEWKVPVVALALITLKMYQDD